MSSWYGTSSANTAPVAGALKIAATPAAAPATRRTRRSAPRNALGKSLLEVRADHGARVQGRSFQAHRPARTERGEAGDRAGDEAAHAEPVLRVVEGLQVLVGRGRGRAAADGASSDQREEQSATGQHGDEPQRKSQHAIEHHADDDALEPGDEQAGHHAGHGGEHDDLTRTGGQGAQFAAARFPDPPRQRHDHPSVHACCGSSPAASANAFSARTVGCQSFAGTRSTIVAISRRRISLTRSTTARPSRRQPDLDLAPAVAAGRPPHQLLGHEPIAQPGRRRRMDGQLVRQLANEARATSGEHDQRPVLRQRHVGVNDGE